MDSKVTVRHLSKKYQLYNKQTDKLMDLFLPFKKKKNRTFFALKDVSFDVNRGETIGVIGLNGSGKSTLSNILAGVTGPTSGEFEVDGETSLLAVNVGLNNQLSGLENIELKCLMLGFKKAEIKEITPEIIDFADIGDFIDQPVKNYSSGMKSRLGFAISAFTNPDVLIIDEALAVGDTTFYQKCLGIINQFKEEGKTIFFISHAIGQMKKMCDKVIWMHYGELKEYGETKEVIENFQAFNKWFNNLQEKEKKAYRGEMLKEQNYSEEIPRKRASKPKQKNFFYMFQVLFLCIVTIYSGLFMFLDQSPLAYFDDLRKNGGLGLDIEKLLNNEEIPDTAAINRAAIVDTASAKLFTDEQLKETGKEVGFGESVFVEKRTDEVYQINYNDKTYFTERENVTFEDAKKVSKYDLLDIYPVLPESLSSSYEFFLTFIGSDYDELTATLRGLSSEEETEEGMILHYAASDFAYTLNEDSKADGFIVSNIEVTDEFMKSVEDNISIISEDKQHLMIDTKEYRLFINREENQLKVEYK